MPMEKVMVKRSGREILKSMLTSTFIVFVITFMIIGLMVFYNKIRYAYDFIPAFLIFDSSVSPRSSALIDSLDFFLSIAV